ncbi:MAG TPA: hypothetical protein VGI92_13340 [Gemmatimonadales bacterium]|jgi:hypothetical protein
MRRSLLFAAAVLVLAACNHLDNQVSIPVINIPSGYVAYPFAPTLMTYSFVDTSTGTNLHLNWITQQNFLGINCFGLSPRANGDTTGSFVFQFAGANVGQLSRLQNGQLDSTIGYFLQGNEPTHGSYAVTSTGALKLTFADGSSDGRFLDASSVIKLVGDTIISDTDLKSNGDSVHAVWHVDWVKGVCQ